MADIKFETLKDKVKERISEKLRIGILGSSNRLEERYSFEALYTVIPAVLVEHLKNNCSENICYGCGAILAEFEKQLHRVVDEWDIRAVHRLCENFPDILPPKCRGNIKILDIWQTDEDDPEWMISFKEKMKMEM